MSIRSNQDEVFPIDRPFKGRLIAAYAFAVMNNMSPHDLVLDRDDRDT